MKAFVLLCDAARIHPDSTFSLLRGGITEVSAPRTQPIQFQGAIVARIAGSPVESGEHDFMLRVLNEDGQPIAPDIAGRFTIPEGGGSCALVLDFGLILPGYGRYTFALTVDRQAADSWDVRAVDKPSQPGSSVPPPTRR